MEISWVLYTYNNTGPDLHGSETVASSSQITFELSHNEIPFRGHKLSDSFCAQY